MAQRDHLLAHLSDVHLPPVPRLPLRSANIKRLLGAANWHRHRRHVHVRDVLDVIVADILAQRPDHIAVTGDLVNLGLPKEHEAALAWLRGLGAPERVSVVPGNHDDYTRLRGDPGYRRWNPYMRGDAGSDDGTPFPFLRRRGPVALIGVGSAMPTRPFESAGRVGPAQLTALRQRLDDTRREGLVRIVAIHHPPHRYGQAWRTGLKDAAALEAVLGEAGADVLLHGHFHRAQLRWIDGAQSHVPIVGVPSASAAIRHEGDLAGYNLLSIARGDGDGRPRIVLVRRGILEPDGPVVEIERLVLAE